MRTSERDDSHPCPVSGCGRSVAGDRLMCKSHWALVPTAIRRRVWDAWRQGEGYGTSEHQEAIAAAVRAVDRALASRAGDQLSMPIGDG